MATIQIKQTDWLKIRSGCGILIYSAGQGLKLSRLGKTLHKQQNFLNVSVCKKGLPLQNGSNIVQVYPFTLTFITLWANKGDNKLIVFLLFFP